MTNATTTLVCLVAALVSGSWASPFPETLRFTNDYYTWFYRWYRGGAWMTHDERHECLRPQNSTCTFLPWKKTQGPSVNFSVNSTIAHHLANVEVNFSVDAVFKEDVVAVYLVDAEEEPRDKRKDPNADFFDYVYVTNTSMVEIETYSIVFGSLVNMRASYQFKYLRKRESNGTSSTYQVLGESPFVEMERGHTEPLQVRLALTGREGEMRVTWVTGQVLGPHVKYGTVSSGILWNQTEATTETYDALDMCDEPATIRSSVYFRHPGYLHDAVMTGLIPGKTYTYRLGSATGVSSPELAFTFPTALGHVTEEMTRPQGFFVFGDLGTCVLQEPGNESDFNASQPERDFNAFDMVSRLAPWGDERTVMERIRQDLDESMRDDADASTPEYAAVIHVGDISYAVGRTYVWDQFGAVVEPVASRLPYMVGIGNHEYDYLANGEGHDLSGSAAALSSGWHPEGGNFYDDSHGECGVPFARRFHMPPAMTNTANPPFWYSFRVGLTHHVVLSSEHRCTVGAPMRVWLEQEFHENVNRNVTPWLVVHLHRPLYCSEKFDSDHAVAKLLRACLEDLLFVNNVDLVFSGHYHAYERTCPVFHGKCRERDGVALAPTHIMIGSGGAELDDLPYLKVKWSRAQQRQQEYGHGRLSVFNATHAHFEFVRARDRVVTDAVWIVSNHKYGAKRR
ncbi:hypothetical protein PsorP6_006201 [Peronosclerospora sorghi]|uniref:Uncharacterized protein n=1 Tax=Peronosclerospora sorghi TaxID=230839 RepID=A0ACC0W3F6_9STRA|nr:hypothetical protein PsorP6_006201 [Peronosclerospora sorghi]